MRRWETRHRNDAGIKKLTMNTSAKIHPKDLTLEQETLMQVFNCIVGDRNVVYVSGPITTGRRFIDWYISKGHALENGSNVYQSVKYEDVLSKNKSDIIGVAHALRKTSSTPVIEPASLHITTWDQNDYHQFWTETLRRFVSQMVILDGWQYSIGCVIEFNYAKQCGIEISNQNGRPIKEQEVHKLVLAAADDIEKRGLALDALRHIAQTLRAQAKKME